MNRITHLFETPFAQILRFDHPPGLDHRDGGVEVPECHAVSLVERGPFSVIRRREFWNFDKNDVLLSFPKDPRTYRHTVLHPRDICLSIHFAPEVVEQTLGILPARGSDLRIPACGRTIFAKFRTEQALNNKELFGIESATLGLIPLFSCNQEWRGSLHRSTQFSYYVKKITNAVELLEAEFEDQHSLLNLSRLFTMSPFHFSRVFKSLVGRSPHQHLLRVRLAHAARRLQQGDSVTNTAYGCGFQNLSHFVRMFRKRFGVPPSKYRIQLARSKSHNSTTSPPIGRSAFIRE
jgi:AraC-like DNA-binding protein